MNTSCARESYPLHGLPHTKSKGFAVQHKRIGKDKYFLLDPRALSSSVSERKQRPREWRNLKVLPSLTQE
ncbi:MAG: hypothetical protein HXS54_12385 [Theionarchaea archaeon]|nr:hypothetical protein [Theionarchaea archaeon]